MRSKNFFIEVFIFIRVWKPSAKQNRQTKTSSSCLELCPPQTIFNRSRIGLLGLIWNIVSSCSSDGKESACNSGDPGTIPGLGRSPGEGNGYPLLYSCLGNSMEEPCRLQSMGSQKVRHELQKKSLKFSSKIWGADSAVNFSVYPYLCLDLFKLCKLLLLSDSFTLHSIVHIRIPLHSC